MEVKKSIAINSAIFPKLLSVAFGKPISESNGLLCADDVTDEVPTPEIMIDLPRGAYLLYLQDVVMKSSRREQELLENYALEKPFSDQDYEDMLKLIMTTVNRNWTNSSNLDILTPFGVEIRTDEKGKQCFALIESAIPIIKAETWECIIIDHLRKSVAEIIECFDFEKSFSRTASNVSGSNRLKISLSAWKFTSDELEQSLSNALRSAFMFTLVSYCYGDARNQYQDFMTFFEAEFFKRVSLIYGIWITRGAKNVIGYVPLYDSFHNLNGYAKADLIEIIKAILDNPDIALDEKLSLKNSLIEEAGIFHHNINSTDVVLEETLIKPAINYILLREKAKETLDSATILCAEGKYIDCANRCYYAMMFTLKSVLEKKGLLANWKANELKETETHRSLEQGFDELLIQGILDLADKSAFDYVKDQRWKCDYSLYKFEKADAENCLNKAKAFYAKAETIT